MIRRLWRRMTTPCTVWPCKRCDRAGRTSWRVRGRWHAARRDMALIAIFAAVVVCGIVLSVGS